MPAHNVGQGVAAHAWADALGEAAEKLTLPDSARFTPEGRRLLVSLGIVEADPLRVEAEEWLRSHRGPVTPATRRVRLALGSPWPDELVEASRRFRNTPWKKTRGAPA